MAMFQSQQVDQTTPTVTVAQDGSGDYHGSTGDVIQEAIDSLGSDAGWIFIKPGTYNVDTDITLNVNNILLSGVRDSTKLSGANTCTILSVSGTNTSLSNLTIDGGGDYASSVSAVSWGGYYGTVENVRFTNSETNAFIGGGWYTNLRDCVVDTCTGNGVNISGTRMRLLDSQITDCTESGIVLGSNKAIVRGNVIENVGRITSPGYVSAGVSFMSNICLSASTGGLYLLGSYSRVTDNFFNEISGKCIETSSSARNIIINGNNILDSPGFGGSVMMTHGIYETSGANLNIITSNAVSDSLTANYFISGADTITGLNGDW